MDDEFGCNERLEQRKQAENSRKVHQKEVGEKCSTSEKKNESVLEDVKMLKHKRNVSNTSAKSSSLDTTLPALAPLSKNLLDGGDARVQLPQRFVVKYLGFRETNNLWGIKYTRKPVDDMVGEAKRMLSTSRGKSLALLKLEVVEDGIVVSPMPQNVNPNFPNGKFTISSISYGVQDLVYTRVFAMIVVKADSVVGEDKAQKSANGSNNNAETSGIQVSPFRCHAFVTDTRETAKNLTYALASAFHVFSQNVASGKVPQQKPRKFAIDLRAQEDIEAEMKDSEA